MKDLAELYGPCRLRGYCDCAGFFGCVDPSSPGRAAPITNPLTVCKVCGRVLQSNHRCKGKPLSMGGTYYEILIIRETDV